MGRSESVQEALRVARSWLFVPGDSAGHMYAKAVAADADVVVLDLEDAVATAKKAEARANVRAVLGRDRPLQLVAVRINDLTTPWWIADLEMAVDAGVDALVVPKTTAIDQVQAVASALARNDVGQSSARALIVPLLETASGILRAEAIAAGPRVAAVALGGEDLALDLGVSRSVSGTELDHARGHLLLACAAAKCGAVDTPTLDVLDVDLVGAQATTAHRLGFTGKFAVHPRQVPAINGAFGPTEEQVAWARAVIAGFERAQESDHAVTTIDGRMIDGPVVAAARRLLKLSRAVAESAGPGAAIDRTESR